MSMSRYIALVDHDRAGFGVVFPDAPGATAMGHTVEEALGHAAEALSDWMAGRVEDGRPLPKPRSWTVLKKDKEVIEALEEGAVMTLVPLVMTSGKAVRANLSLDEGLLRAIDEAARRNGVTRSAFLATAAREKIEAGA
jgi:predicted RNase H-like HicB family nuclease